MVSLTGSERGEATQSQQGVGGEPATSSPSRSSALTVPSSMEVFKKSKMERTSFWFLSDMVASKYSAYTCICSTYFNAILSLLIWCSHARQNVRRNEYDSDTLGYFYYYYRSGSERKTQSMEQDTQTEHGKRSRERIMGW